jgi:hypothetical protein
MVGEYQALREWAAGCSVSIPPHLREWAAGCSVSIPPHPFWGCPRATGSGLDARLCPLTRRWTDRRRPEYKTRSGNLDCVHSSDRSSSPYSGSHYSTPRRPVRSSQPGHTGHHP